MSRPAQRTPASAMIPAVRSWSAALVPQVRSGTTPFSAADAWPAATSRTASANSAATSLPGWAKGRTTCTTQSSAWTPCRLSLRTGRPSCDLPPKQLELSYPQGDAERPCQDLVGTIRPRHARRIGLPVVVPLVIEDDDVGGAEVTGETRSGAIR